MKIGYSSIILILLVLIALAVSGCSGGAGGSATPTPTFGPGSLDDDATPAPTTPDEAQPSKISQLYDTDKLQSYKLHMTQTVGGNTTSVTEEVSYTDETYNGVAARHTKIITDADSKDVGSYLYPAGSGMLRSVTDVYISKANKTPISGHRKVSNSTKTFSDIDLFAFDAASYLMSDILTSVHIAESGTSHNVTIDGMAAGDPAEAIMAADDPTLTRVGTDTITLNGQSYPCTKYAYSSSGNNIDLWYNPQVPMPMKIQSTDTTGATMTMELLSWS